MSRIVVLGGGESGVGAAVLAQKKDLMYSCQTPDRSSIITKRCSINMVLNGKTEGIQQNWFLMPMK